MTRVTFEGRRFPLLPGESVLDALIRGGATVEHSCRKGTCHICLLKAEEGDPGPVARERLPVLAQEKGYFLPCQCRTQTDLTLTRPDRAELFVGATIYEKTIPADGIARILLEPDSSLIAVPGQYLSVRSPAGVVRSYSIANVPSEDYFLEIHVKKIPAGRVSSWLVDDVQQGDRIEIGGPTGACTYQVTNTDTPLLFIGTGTGIGPLVGICRDAIARGHKGPIRLVHGVHDPSHLYWTTALEDLRKAHSGIECIECCSGTARPGAYHGRAVDAALGTPIDPRTHVYLAGAPGPVEEARVRCIQQGLKNEHIRADTFEFAHLSVPRDKEKLRNLSPDPELWEALEQGAKLRRILSDFYSRVYRDERLAPFFHRITQQRAIDKQYEFTVDLFTGSKHYFGLGPYNAHHWMVISDELFDYREHLLEQCIRREGLPEHLIFRWLAIDERFRREIVKPNPRGLFVDGKERPVEGWEEETLSVGSLCDGCEREMPPGTTGRINGRTGQLFCHSCGARRVGETIPPVSRPLRTTPA